MWGAQGQEGLERKELDLGFLGFELELNKRKAKSSRWRDVTGAVPSLSPTNLTSDALQNPGHAWPAVLILISMNERSVPWASHSVKLRSSL